MPYCVKVIDAVGSTGAAKLSCNEKTSTSPIVWVLLKLTCSQSGNAFCVASFQPLSPAPLPPQFWPLRSPLIAADGGKLAPLWTKALEAVATPPLTCAATFIDPAPVAVTVTRAAAEVVTAAGVALS